jgi:hypothetical protein
MKVGLIMMSLAFALVIATVVVRVTVGSEPGLVPAEEVATKSPGQAQRSSSGQEGSATKKSSSEKESSSSESMGTDRPPPLVVRWSSARRKRRSSKRYSSRKPKAGTLSPQRLNRRAGKHLLKHPLGRCPNHNCSTNLSHKSNRCLTLKGGAGLSPPKES